MAKQPKAKPKAGNRNEDRKNGKATKTGNVRHKRTQMDPLALIRMGKGSFVTINRTLNKK